MRLACVAWLLTIALITGCGSSDEVGTQVELWVEGDLSRVDGLQSLDFVIRDAHLQPAGFEIYPDHRITSEWLPMDLNVAEFQLVAGNPIAQRVAALEVEEAKFDRVFLRPLALRAEGEANETLRVKNVMEPIAAQFETNGDAVKVVLKIIVLPTSRGDEELSIFAQDTDVLID